MTDFVRIAWKKCEIIENVEILSVVVYATRFNHKKNLIIRFIFKRFCYFKTFFIKRKKMHFLMYPIVNFFKVKILDLSVIIFILHQNRLIVINNLSWSGLKNESQEKKIKKKYITWLKTYFGILVKIKIPWLRFNFQKSFGKTTAILQGVIVRLVVIRVIFIKILI